jgi:hypothetical protein
MDTTTAISKNHPHLWRHVLPAGLMVAGAFVLGGWSSAAADGGTHAAPDAVEHVFWSGPAADGGFSCLRDTGGASGQCDAEMGIGPWDIPATDGGYRCLRDTGGASGQCNAAMRLVLRHP